MPRPSHDAGEIARSALGELPPAERAELLITILIETRNLRLLAQARNRLTEEINEMIVDGTLDDLEDDNC